jgi:IS30 family transposase
MSGKRKVSVLTLQQRVEVLKKHSEGKSCRAIAEEFNCGKTQIQSVVRNSDKIMEEWNKCTNSSIKYLKRRKTGYEELNDLIYEWFCVARSKNLPISGPLLKEKSLELAMSLRKCVSNCFFYNIYVLYTDCEARPPAIEDHDSREPWGGLQLQVIL